MKTTKEPRITTSSLSTKSSFEIAAAETAVVSVIQPVFVMSEFPGSASISAFALTFGSVGAGVALVEEKRKLFFRVSARNGAQRRTHAEGAAARGNTARRAAIRKADCITAEEGPNPTFSPRTSSTWVPESVTQKSLLSLAATTQPRRRHDDALMRNDCDTNANKKCRRNNEISLYSPRSRPPCSSACAVESPAQSLAPPRDSH